METPHAENEAFKRRVGSKVTIKSNLYYVVGLGWRHMKPRTEVARTAGGWFQDKIG